MEKEGSKMPQLSELTSHFPCPLQGPSLPPVQSEKIQTSNITLYMKKN